MKDYKNVDYILSNALNINKWAKKIKFGDKVLICFWFIIHEIFSNEKDLVNFFKKLNIKKFDILICEINRVDSKILKENLDYTLMPEYFYFHDISNQKLFSEKDLNKMLIKSSYKRIENFKFDQYRSKIVIYHQYIREYILINKSYKSFYTKFLKQIFSILNKKSLQIYYNVFQLLY